MKRKCDQCNRTATVHEVEIIKGKKVEKHLCDDHAKEEGIALKDAYTPINELLTNFVKTHSGVATQQDMVCDNCGQTFAQFRDNSLLGCPRCYAAFEELLGQLLERAHEGGTHHLGKVPSRSGTGERRQEQLLRLRRRLSDAVTAEDYELAAKLRDDLTHFEDGADDDSTDDRPRR